MSNRRRSTAMTKPKFPTKVYFDFVEIKNTFADEPKDRTFHFEILEEKSEKTLFKTTEKTMRKDEVGGKFGLGISLEVELDASSLYKICLSVVRKINLNF